MGGKKADEQRQGRDDLEIEKRLAAEFDTNPSRRAEPKEF
jgi:hypothetical protein